MPKLIHLYPIPGVSIPGVPAIEQDATAEQWADYQRYQPPAFTTDPPHPPPIAAVLPTQTSTEEVGVLDSTEA